MSDKPSDRFSDTLAWDTLDVDQWCALISEMLRRKDIEAIPGVLALMAVHGYAAEADLLRRAMLLGTANEATP